ncbi:glycosyltransferase [Niallia taxi]|nr:glycosyltransferase [Niallia taxi]
MMLLRITVELIQPNLDDPRITLLRHSYNQGMSKSLNTGLQIIDTPYFVQLDPDDWFYPNTLAKLMDAAGVSGKDVALLSGNINVCFENESGQVLRSLIR